MKKAYVDLPEGQIHYLSAGQGPALLLFHQAPMNAEEWVEIIPALSETFTVYAPDMMGHGNSDDPGREYEVEDFAATSVRFMDALGIEQAVVCGNHSGGALATAVAVSAPERVSKLVISCEMLISVEMINGFLEKLKSQPLSRELPMDEAGQFLVDAWERYKALAPTAVADVRFLPFIVGQKSRLRPFDTHFAVLRWMAASDWLTQVQCPALVIGAEHDLFFNQALMDGVSARMKDARSLVIRDAGALSTFEQPAAWSEAILGFAGN